MSKKIELDDLLSLKEAAPKIGMAIGTIYNRISRTKNFPVPFFKIGKSIMFQAKDIENYLESRRIKQSA